MKMRVFWDIKPCSLVGEDRRFKGAYCLRYQGDESHKLYSSGLTGHLKTQRTQHTAHPFIHINIKKKILSSEFIVDLSCLRATTSSKINRSNIWARRALHVPRYTIRI
jgi:hypothetical protein